MLSFLAVSAGKLGGSLTERGLRFNFGLCAKDSVENNFKKNYNLKRFFFKADIYISKVINTILVCNVQLFQFFKKVKKKSNV